MSVIQVALVPQRFSVQEGFAPQRLPEQQLLPDENPPAAVVWVGQ
jgi:hypothetical protein